MNEGTGFRVRSLATSVYLPTFLFAVGQGAVIPILPLFALDLGLSVPMAGAIVALRSLGNLVCDVPAGMLVSRFGERRALMIGSGLLALVAVGLGTRPPVALVVVLVWLMGAAWSIWMLARLAYATEASPIQHRGRVMSIMGGSTRIGHFLGPVLGSLAVAWFGLAAAFFVHAILAVAALVTLYVVPSGIKTDTRRSDTSLKVVREVLRDHRRVFLTAGLAVIAIQIVRTAKDAILPLWGNGIGLTASQVSLIFGLSYAVDMTLFYPVGTIMDRFGRKWAGVPCLLVLSLGLFLIPLTDAFTGLLLVGALIGFGNGLGSGINMTLGSDLSPRGRRAEFLGVWRLVTDTGSVSGPLVIAAITSALTLGAASMATAGLGLLGAAVLGWLVPETLPPREALIEDP